ncbi:hypothetical protein B0I35DRAFT_411440 [Stachybotrys elegans]|uniref:Uncharacterized protein n=1 Tax=Stachybotrys elegans TaxID=80388 RepID=A0A8K0WNV8_9HYPO|nr:hypothetical protein B0I35DRAFT_411440 [Stachybotrys elegans]
MPAQQEILDTLARGGGYWEIWQLIPRLAKEIHLHTPTDQTIKALSEKATGQAWSVVTTLCLISRGAIKSLVQGTVAYDWKSGDQDSAWYRVPSERAGGIYVIGLCREGSGQFLNGPEMGRLVEGIRDYRDGCRIGQASTPHERQLVGWVKTVDGALTTSDGTGEPLFHILAAQNLPIVMVQKVVMRTLTKEQLVMAEQLVMTLADSLVSRSGFNVAEGGGNPSRYQDAWDHAERNVLGNAFVMSNLDNALDDTTDRTTFVKSLTDHARRLGRLEERIQESEALVERLDTLRPFHEVHAELMDRLDETLARQAYIRGRS